MARQHACKRQGEGGWSGYRVDSAPAIMPIFFFMLGS